MKKILLLFSLVFAFSAYAEDPAPVEISFGDFYTKNKTDFVEANKFTAKDVTVYGAQNDNNDPPRYYDGHIRYYKKTSLIVECATADIDKIEIITNESYPFPATSTASSGVVTVNSNVLATWQSASAVSKVNIVNTGKTARMSGLKVYLKAKSTTGINEVGYDDEAPAEYFNLLGVRVDETALSAGHIYIRRCGTKAEKVMIR